MLVRNQTDLKLANKRYGQTSTRFGWAGHNVSTHNTGGNSSRLNGINVTNQDGIRKLFYHG